MKPFAVLAALLVGAAAVLSPVTSFAQPVAQKADRYKVVLQVSDNDPAKWNLALNNARNIRQDLGKANVDVEIVAYGPGLGMLKMESKVADRLYGGISYVDAGVVHIMKRQREGWAYVRP